MQYPTHIRHALVRRMLVPGGISTYALARETGINRNTLSRWRAEARSVGEMTDDEEQRPACRPQDRTPQEKLALVLEAAALEDAELGGFLRREGVHEAQLAQWREVAQAAALEALRGPRKRREGKSAREKGLERELRRKDKALAETAALLVLQGKVRALLGEEGNDTTGS